MINCFGLARSVFEAPSGQAWLEGLFSIARALRFAAVLPGHFYGHVNVRPACRSFGAVLVGSHLIRARPAD